MRRAVAVGVAAACVAALLAVALPPLLGAVGTAALRDAGLPGAAVAVTSLGLGESHLSLTLPGGDAARLVVRHPPGLLLRGRAERITLSGATLRLAADSDGRIRVPGRAGAPGQGGSGLPALPAEEILVEDSRIVLESPGGSHALAVQAHLRSTGDGLDGVAELHGEAARLRLDGRMDADGELTLTVAGEALDLGIPAALAGAGVRVAGRGGIAGTLRGRVAENGLSLSPEGCLRLSAAELAVSGEPMALPKGLCLRGADGPMLDGAGGALRLHGVAEADSLRLPARGIAADDLALTVAYREGTASPFTAELTRAVLRGTQRPPLLAPVTVTGRAEGSAGGPLSLQAIAKGPAGVTLELTGSHDRGSGAGSAELRLRPVTFHEGSPGAAALMPRYAETITAVTGRLSGRGQIAWSEGSFTSRGEVLLRQVGGAIGPVSVDGVSGVLRLTSLFPPVLPSGQTLAVQRLDVGVPLTGGQVTLGLTQRGVLDIDRAEWQWAGGMVRAKPFTIAVEAPRGLIELEAEGLDLGAVLGLAGVQGLDATGTLSGTLPVRIGKDAVRLDGGVLEAVGPGTLHYDPVQPPAFLQGDPGSPTDMLMQALTDFRYDSLRATVDGLAGGELQVRLAIRGGNPQFYGGYPVALNLNLSGALDRILRQGLDAYRIPEAVRDRMLEFERKGPS